MDNRSVGSKRVVYRAFQDIDAYLEDLYSVYQDLYRTVRKIRSDIPLQDPHSFEYCRSRRYFTLIIPYTNHGELLLERLFANDQLTWAMIGGSLRHDLMETFIDAASRHASKAITNLELGEVEPIAFLENCFTYGSQSHYHYGIAFVARIRNLDPIQNLRSAVYSRGHFIPYTSANIPLTLTHNQEIMTLVRNYLKERDVRDVPEFEISENAKYQTRYAFHSAVTKPLFRFFGHVHFEYTIEDLEKKIKQIVQEHDHKKILDVACGESTFVIDLAQLPNVQLVVANDVAWSQIKLMSETFAEKFRNIQAFILFTNHDARSLPFDDRYFDFVFCKNVLHHMENLPSAKRLLQEVVRVAKHSLIVEIMDPQFESLWGKARHHYYMDFLHDAGHHFLSREEFTMITHIVERTEIFEMSTIRGIYQFACFSNTGKP